MLSQTPRQHFRDQIHVAAGDWAETTLEALNPELDTSTLSRMQYSDRVSREAYAITRGCWPYNTARYEARARKSRIQARLVDE